MSEMSIGEFARRSRLSPKALRLYDELGLLTPVRVDDNSGYRLYVADQLEQAGRPRVLHLLERGQRGQRRPARVVPPRTR